MKTCEHLDELLKSEIEIIKRHLNEHKYFRHIDKDDDAIADFISNYGFICREMYCGNVCKDRYDCDIAKSYLNRNGKNGTKNTSG